MKQWWNAWWGVAVWFVALTPALAAPEANSLEALVQKYWAAELSLDYGTVYGMLTAADQGTIAREDYVKLRMEEGPLRYLAADIGETDTAGSLAWVNVKYKWMLPKHPSPGRSGEMWQLWRQADGWHPIATSERNQWPILPPHLRPAADEAALTKRTRELWKFKAEQDWKSVYAYLPPEYRARVPMQEFLKSKAKLLYFSPQVQWVEAKGNEARASIAFQYKFNDPAVTKMQPRDERIVEPWVKVDGDWYLDVLVLDEAPAPAKKGVN